MRESKFINASDKIFVAGHRGMVGKAVYRQLLKKGYKNLITCERNKLDLEVYTQVNDFIKTFSFCRRNSFYSYLFDQDRFFNKVLFNNQLTI